MSANPTQRFSDRVENYIKYRPHYPQAMWEFFRDALHMQAGNVVADVGSGTGILTEPLIQAGQQVYAIEPNREMREAAERLLQHQAGFISIDGTAEQTTLPENSVDMIVAAQAFHWFDRARTKVEFRRIIRPDGIVALIWNDRRTDTTPFLREYENLLLGLATDYAEVNHRNIDDEALQEFFAPHNYHTAVFGNVQYFDYDGLAGRLLSSSYAPLAGHPRHEPMMSALRDIFDRYAEAGTVAFEYDTRVYYGTVK
jgi:SAM-dependent methyltransferase